MKQLLDALVIGVKGREQLTPLVRVAQQLIDGLMHRVFNARAFKLGHHNGNAVDEQHRIRDNMTPAAGQFHLELIDNQKIIILGMIKINVADRLRSAFVPVFQTICHGSFKQQPGGGLVDFHQTVSIGLFQIINGLSHAGFIEPWPPVPEIDSP